MFGGQDGVLGADVLGEHGFEFLLLDFLLGHDGSCLKIIKYNKVGFVSPVIQGPIYHSEKQSHESSTSNHFLTLFCAASNGWEVEQLV
jgi:hypothetical protein